MEGEKFKNVKRNIFLKKIIVLLCVTMIIFYFLPISVFANEISQMLEEENSFQETDFQTSNELTENYTEEEILENGVTETLVNPQETEEEPSGENIDDYMDKIVIGEEEEKRTANEKHYLLEDGTSIAMIYPANIHYKENGKFVDVDNTLTEKQDTKETMKVKTEDLTKEEKITQEQLKQKSKNLQKNEETKEKNATELINDIEKDLTYNIELNKQTKVYENKSNSYATKFTNKTNGYQLGSLTSENNTISSTFTNTYGYENDMLKTITHNGFTYSFIYDTFGNQKQVKVGNNLLITNEYEAKNGNLVSSTYGNNYKISYTYDRFNRLTSQTGTSGGFTYAYDGRSNLKSITDSVNNNTTNYTYDLANRLVKQENTNGYSATYEYDKNSNVSKITDKYNDDSKVTEYNYDINNNINNVKMHNGTIIMTNYDALSRAVGRQIKTQNEQSYNTEFTYTNIEGTNKTTTQVKSIKNGEDAEINYTYYPDGNIKTISSGDELLHKYYYDGLGQLIREDDTNRNMTITYEYDQGGNILNKKIHPYSETETLQEAIDTKIYQYENTEWKDQLTTYNNKPITYDAIGNPLTYDGNTYSWQNGRQLTGITNEGKGQTITYKYNDNGIRTEKTVNGTTTTYYLSGSKVIYEKTGDNVIYYSYDEAGSVIGLNYNGEQYYYKKNLQGDIIGILDSSLNQIAKYNYDAWGKILSIIDNEGNTIEDQTHIANINSYRYRGYRYDSETELYYLQSRYYSPEWSRFINADGQINDGITGANLYTYCANNPIIYSDPDGEVITISITTIIGIVIIGYVAVVCLPPVIDTIGTIITDLSSTIDTPSKSGSSSSNSSSNNSRPKTNTGTSSAASNSKSGRKKNNDSEYNKRINKKVKQAKKNSNQGYSSYRQLKKSIGSPRKGYEWHHIIEQSQIQKSGFDVQLIQNKDNVIAISKGIHRKISGYYSSIDNTLSKTMSVRNWLAGQSYEAQYEFGINILKRFGGL